MTKPIARDPIYRRRVFNADIIDIEFARDSSRLAAAVDAVIGRGRPNGRWRSHRGGIATKRPRRDRNIPCCTKTLCNYREILPSLLEAKMRRPLRGRLHRRSRRRGPERCFLLSSGINLRLDAVTRLRVSALGRPREMT
jgi:hypothetical protein